MAFPHYQQRNIMDCGATCLKIIAKYYGKDLPIGYLRRTSYTSREGASLAGLARSAEAVGLRALPVKVHFMKLKAKAPLPLIVHWNQVHFVVVYKITDTTVYVSDPAHGLLKYSHKQFLRSWINNKADEFTDEGIALLLETTPNFAEKVTHKFTDDKINTRIFLYHYIKPYKRIFFQIFLSLLAGSLLQLLFPFLTQNIVDTGINNKDINFIWLILMAQLMLTIGQTSIEFLRSWMFLYISSRINISLISDFFIKLMKLPISYFDTRLTGDLIQRIGDHKRIESFLIGTSFNIIFSFFNLVIYSIILLYYSYILYLIFLAGSILYIGWVTVFLKRRKKLDYKRFQQAGDTNSKIYELINGMQEIKLHNAEQQKRWGWERVQIKIYEIRIQALRLEQSQSIGARLINQVKNIFITIITANLVISGQLTLGMMLSVSYIIGQLNGPINQLVGVIGSWQDAHISLDRLAEIHAKNDEIDNRDNNNNLISSLHIPSNHTIQFKNVSFRYNELMPNVLNNIDFIIPGGKVTAIVGTSGSGKTTLLKLLMRFYEPSEGSITIGGAGLNKTDLVEWRTICGVVMQEGYLFNDTIANNIAIGENEPDMKHVQYVADIANISEFVTSLPLGFNTKVGQEGMGISTGQRQRMLIARAIYKNPDIILLDEATSALDANNEREIIEKLKDFYHGKTVVVIAHRLSTVKDADNIVVLDHGNIVEQGTHHELVRQKGHYYNLVRNQLELGE